MHREPTATIVHYVHRYKRPPRKRKPAIGSAIVTAPLTPKRKRIAGQIVRPTRIVSIDSPRQRRWRRMVESERRADPEDDTPKVGELVRAMQERLRQD